MNDKIDAYMATSLVTFSPGDSIIDAMRRMIMIGESPRTDRRHIVEACLFLLT